MYEGNDIGEEKVDDKEIDEDKIDEEELDEGFYETNNILVMAIYAVIHVLNQFLIMMDGEQIEPPLTQRRIISIGYEYIHQGLNDDPAILNSIASDYGQTRTDCAP
ncbi:hypothetical protein GBA52_020073 [Prunus armeniaca]|nr:hypothetical protein GBA52_020073 [Prunus armeniaca]